MPRFALDEAGARFWTALFGGITALSLIAAGVFSLSQYFDSREKERESREKDRTMLQLQTAATQFAARQAFANKHLELCSQASAAAGTIATSKDEKRKTAAINDFWQLYWGPLGIVENRDVSRSMIAFGECLGGNCGGESLTTFSLDIAHQCRRDVEKNFELNLPDLDNKQERSTSKN